MIYTTLSEAIRIAELTVQEGSPEYDPMGAFSGVCVVECLDGSGFGVELNGPNVEHFVYANGSHRPARLIRYIPGLVAVGEAQ